MSVFIGIDPGASGGLAVMWTEHEGAWQVEASPMLATETDIADWLRSWETGHALIEKVSAMPGQGVTSMFKFGQSYGTLRGILTALRIPWEEVRPQKWQAEFSLVFPKSMGLTVTEKKNRHKAKAQQLFPSVKVTHAVADALLLASFCQRKYSRHAPL